MSRYLFSQNTNDRIAYIIGKTEFYNDYMIGKYEQGARLVSEEEPFGYAGGWVWKTIAEAEEFRDRYLQTLMPNCYPEDYSVYEVELHSGWIFDVLSKRGFEKMNHLISDALILRRAV
jgi:hypothetical protein